VGVPRSPRSLIRAVGRTVGPDALYDVRRSLGARPGGEHESPHFREGAFHNTDPMQVLEGGSRVSLARELATKGRRGRPAGVVPLVTPVWPETAADCAATWLGHATVLLEVGGRRVLTDPIWSDRCSPSGTLGPSRNHPVPVAVDDLPHLDAVLISHDHYDHLDMATVDRLTSTQTVPFVVPLGVGAHLRRWGVPVERIIELDWGRSVVLDGLTLTCTEARHFSGRLMTGNNTTLWSSWLVEAGGRRVFFGGDSGYTEAFGALGRRTGPIDLSVLPVGAYDARWPDVHMTPEEAVRVHRELGAGVLVPIHWATFDLAFHPWAEPADRVRREAATHGVRLAQPRPGERVNASGDLPTTEWWHGLA
jgi:L-ascorbate metabolism protein UlaG (beta-lactamase superfamily)